MSTKDKKEENILYRYTNLPVLLDILHRKKLTLLNPDTWDDRNDSYYLNHYKENNNLKTLLALCFTEGKEAFHHWKIYSGNESGVRITFKKKELIKHFENNPNILMREVNYSTIRGVDTNPQLSDLPFLKRKVFKDETEFRIIYQDSDFDYSSKEFDIVLSCIDRITLSPWLPKDLLNSLKKTINSIDGCDKMKVFKSSLIDNNEWKKITTNLHN